MWASPPRSPTIVGSAVATIVPSSAASSITSTRPVKIRRTGAARSPLMSWSELRDGGEQPLGVRRVVVVQEAGTHGAVRGEAEVLLELPGVVVAVPDGDLAVGERA